MPRGGGVGELQEALGEAHRLVGIERGFGGTRAHLHADNPSVHAKGIGQGRQGHVLLEGFAVGILPGAVAFEFALGIAQTQVDGGLQGDADGLQVELHGAFHRVGGVGPGGEGMDGLQLLGGLCLEVGRQRQGFVAVDAELEAQVGADGFRLGGSGRSRLRGFFLR